jgi:hypothetical protein
MLNIQIQGMPLGTDASRPQITKSKAKSTKMESPAGMTS